MSEAEPARPVRSRGTPRGVVVFGSSARSDLGVRDALHLHTVAGVGRAVRSGALGALVLDARGEPELSRALDLLRTLFDDPRAPARRVHPRRVVAVIASGDVEAAFALGRFGIAGFVEEHAVSRLERQLTRILTSTRNEPVFVTPTLAPPRSARLSPRLEGEPPTVAIGQRHAPETLAALARYRTVLRAAADESSVFADVATLMDVMVDEDLTCQTNLAAKAGASHSGQFIGSFEFYRELRRTRYAHIVDHPHDAIAMDVFIAVDEVLHEVLHLLFLANQLRAGITPASTLFAEELNLTWWQAVIHNRVFPEWLADRHILEINDDFLLSEANAKTRGFWTTGTVFERYASYPWVPYVIARLPERESYIGERADLTKVIALFRSKPETAFLVAEGRERLAVPVAFHAYPRVPETLRLRAA